MNQDQFAGKWKQLRGQIKAKWGKLTDDELDQIEGNFDMLAGKLQERYGMARAQVERDLDELSRTERMAPSGAASDARRGV